MPPPFSPADIEQFLAEGFLRLDRAFPRRLAGTCRDILWRDTGCDPHDPSTWTQPVIRLWDYPQPPFREAANTPVLHQAFDQLAGLGQWLPRTSLGTFPVRFPHAADPGDAGWHVDASFAGESGDWRVNYRSRERALLLLFLFSDIGEFDAPTRIRVGSHLAVPSLLAPAGERGMSTEELTPGLDRTAALPVALATGEAGTVYLCHPFLVHAAQPHHGTSPRFLAQPPLYLAKPFELHRPDHAYSPVEAAIRRGLAL